MSYAEYGTLDKRSLINAVSGLLLGPKSVSYVSFVTKLSNQRNSTKSFSKCIILVLEISSYTHVNKVSGVNKLTCFDELTRSFLIFCKP